MVKLLSYGFHKYYCNICLLPDQCDGVIFLSQCFTGIPEADLRNIYHGTVTVKARQAITIEIPIVGKPTPTVSWIANGVKLKGKWSFQNGSKCFCC